MARHASLVVTFASALALAGPAGAQPSAAPSGPPAAAVRLVRSTSGTHGAQQGGRYLIEDPRTVFAPERDRQVIVYFEWEGRAGPHHCQARWKDPSGKVVLDSPIDYTAPSGRFGVFWTMTLPEKATRGLWAVEAIVDGQPGGTHVFEIGTGAAAAAATPRPLLPPAELYKRAVAALGTVEAVGATSQIVGQGPALAIDANHVAVGFSTIEGASTIRVRASGHVQETQEVVGFDRRQGWAILPAPAHGLVPLTVDATPLAIGDRFYAVTTGDDGGQVITEAAIVGQEQGPAARFRLNGHFAAGSPLLNDRGDLVGMVVSTSPAAELGPSALVVLSAEVRVPVGGLLVPVARLEPSPTSTSLAELARRGEFLPPLSAASRNVISGVFAGRVERGGPVPMPMDQKFVFSRREGHVSVFVQWDPKEKKDALTWFEVADADHRKLGRGEPTKVKLRPGQLFFSTWTFDITKLPPGTYRVDLMLDDAAAWRGYVKVVD